jgi:hypothetical protein
MSDRIVGWFQRLYIRAAKLRPTRQFPMKQPLNDPPALARRPTKLGWLRNTYAVCRTAFPTVNPSWDMPYGYARQLPDDAIAFEFLRRNPSYWTAWIKALGLSFQPSEWPADKLVAYRHSGIGRKLYKKFGVWAFADPRLPLEPGSLPWAASSSISARFEYAVAGGDSERSFNYRFREKSPTTVTIDFLADGPVDEQLEFARWALGRVRGSLMLDRKAAPRFQRQHFPAYLRLLDARMDRASFTQMVQLIYRGRAVSKDLVRKQYGAAVRFRDGGYRDLLLWGRISEPRVFKTAPRANDDEMPDEW